MKTKARLLSRGDTLPNGDKIADDCTIEIGGNVVGSAVFPEFDMRSEPLGKVISMDVGSGKDSCLVTEVELREEPVNISRFKKFVNWIWKRLFGKEKYPTMTLLERIRELTGDGHVGVSMGFQIKERDGKLIKDITARCVSIVNKNSENEKQ